MGTKGRSVPSATFWLMAALAIAVVATVALRGWYSQRSPAEPRAEMGKAVQPPTVDLAGVDPSVARAIERAMEAVGKSPTEASVWGQLGMTLLAHEFSSQAVECFVQAAARDPDDPRWPYLHARSIILMSPTSAVPLLERAATLAGHEPEAPCLRLVELLLELNERDAAQRHLETFLQHNSSSARAQLAQGRLYFLQGDYAACLASLDQAAKHGGARKSVGVLMAEALRRLGQPETAELRRREADQMSEPSWPDPYFDHVSQLRTGLKAQLVRSDQLFGQGKIDESIRLLERTIGDYPESDWARILLARALIRERRLGEAERVLAEALKLAPQSVEAQFRMGVTHHLGGRHREAAEWFRKAVQGKPDFAMGHFNLGYCLAQLGDADGAITAYRTAVRCQPDLYDAHAALGDLLARQGKSQEAIEHLELALMLKPGDAWATKRREQLMPRQPTGGSIR
jgi:tetratricopeptide (TPR) repeat protein